MGRKHDLPVSSTFIRACGTAAFDRIYEDSARWCGPVDRRCASVLWDSKEMRLFAALAAAVESHDRFVDLGLTPRLRTFVESCPFQLLDRETARRGILEYGVFLAMPDDAAIAWLRRTVHDGYDRVRQDPELQRLASQSLVCAPRWTQLIGLDCDDELRSLGHENPRELVMAGPSDREMARFFVFRRVWTLRREPVPRDPPRRR